MRKLAFISMFLLISSAVPAAAQMGGGVRGMHPGTGTAAPQAPRLNLGAAMMGQPTGHGLVVTVDGTALVVKNALSGSGSTLVALKGSPLPLWSLELDAPALVAAQDGTFAYVTSMPVRQSILPGRTALKSTVRAVSLSSGAVAWSYTADGIVMNVEPFDGGTYLVVVSGMQPMIGQPLALGADLVALAPDGTVLWKYSLLN
jgi:hypothetical protein